MQPAGASSSSGAGKIVAIVLGGVVGLIVLVGGGLLLWSVVGGGDDIADGAILLEPVGSPGPNPFGPSAAPEPDEHLLAFVEQGARTPADAELAATISDPADGIELRNGQAVVNGGVPGLYGGTGRAGSCDPQQIADYLAANPDRADAWAAVFDIDAAEIPAFLDTLTPLNLGADTRVINHGFEGGRATPHHAVLQRGTAVLVDEFGVPRVRCECGNPLLEPAVEVTEPVYEGTPWENFRETTVIVVERSPQPLRGFEYSGIRPDDPIRGERPVRTLGDQDEIVVASDTTPPSDADLSGLCGTVIRSDTDDEYGAVLFDGDHTDQVCAEMTAVADTWVNEYYDVATEIDGWRCERSDGQRFPRCISDHMAFDIVPMPTEPQIEASYDDWDLCGAAEAPHGAFLDFGVLRSPDSLVTCDEAVLLAVDFFVDAGSWRQGWGPGAADLPPEEKVFTGEVRGWACTTGYIYIGVVADDVRDAIGRPGCSSPGGDLVFASGFLEEHHGDMIVDE